MNKPSNVINFSIIAILWIGTNFSSVSAQSSSVDSKLLQRKYHSFYKTSQWNKRYNVKQPDKIYFLLDTVELNRHCALTTVADRPDYMPFAMTLKFYPNKKLRVIYQPTLLSSKLLSTHNGYLDELAKFNVSSQNISEAYNIKEASEKLFIDRPDLVQFVWKEIPEPHRLITDRKQLRRRSAEESIISLLENEKFNTPTKLEKRVEDKGPWAYSGTENLQVSQTYLENWTQGGENSIVLQSDLLLKADYNKNKIEWENYIRNKVGIINSETYKAQINNDQIIMNSKIGLKASNKWYYSFVSNFKSQLFNNYADETKTDMKSRLLSPAYFTLSLGMDYKPNKNFTLMLSPVSAKMTYVMDTVKIDPSKFNIEDGKKSAFNNGLSVTNSAKWEISTELQLTSNLDAFIGYGSSSDIYQIDYEVIFDMRINKYLSTRLNTQFRYFTNESLKLQLRENIAVSFNVKF